MIQRLKRDLITSSSSISPLSPVEQHALRRKIVHLQLQLQNKKEVGREKRRIDYSVYTMSIPLLCIIGNQQKNQCIFMSIYTSVVHRRRKRVGLRTRR